MYDDQTASLIRDAPMIGDLSLERLPERLTELYSKLVSTRLALAESPTTRAEIDSLVTEMRSIAGAYEVYTLALPDAEDRRSAAFLSASAHHLVHRSHQSRPDQASASSFLSPSSISPDLSAMLLFLVGGYTSDAREVADQLRYEDSPPLERSLMVALARLARGELVAVRDSPTLEFALPEDIVERAAHALWQRLLGAVKALATSLLGQPVESDPDEALLAVRTRSVHALATTPALPAATGSSFFTLAGPHHVASLLEGASRVLQECSVTHILPPGEVVAADWSAFLRALAIRRPYLWPNHQEAIAKGYLEPGTSSVLSFPTGGGKSTLAELKIAANLLLGKRAVFLAPTHALVWQTMRALELAFPEHTVAQTLSNDGFYSELETSDLPDVAVMTPERCLMLLNVSPSTFADVGTIVFDECHLMHPRDPDLDRRSLDSVLCLLQLIDAVDDADVLLMSAMISNADELAEWIGEISGRPSVAFSTEWKPTRQARGCVVYEAERTGALQSDLRSAWEQRTQETTPAPLKRQLTAQPFGFFGLQQSWVTTDIADYAHLPLRDGTVTLGANADWHLTANKNAVSADLGRQVALAGIKTLIFVQNRAHAESIAKTAAQLGGGGPIVLTEEEEAFKSEAILDLGAEEHLIGPQGMLATVHHGLLLPSERRLSESLFARPDGVNLMAATPTLAQGMNLPVEAVIIAGDSRFDANLGRQAQLEAHELLNAAGRAGRAGHRASGLVLVVPSKVVSFDTEANEITSPWVALRENIFSKSDQCLRLDDPLENILDRIQEDAAPDSRGLQYFVDRLPVDAEAEDPGSTARRVLSRSLTAFRARRDSQTMELNNRIEISINTRLAQLVSAGAVGWRDQAASSAGVSVAVVEAFDRALTETPLGAAAGVSEALDWLFDWFRVHPDCFEHVCWSADTIKHGLGPKHWKSFESEDVSLDDALGLIRAHTHSWIGGQTYRAIALQMGVKERSLGRCDAARKFGKNAVLDLGYAAGLLTQVIRDRIEHEQNDQPAMSASIATLGSCLREGVDSPEKLALRYILGPYRSRVGCHNTFATIASAIGPAAPDEDFSSLRERVSAAIDSIA